MRGKLVPFSANLPLSSASLVTRPRLSSGHFDDVVGETDHLRSTGHGWTDQDPIRLSSSASRSSCGADKGLTKDVWAAVAERGTLLANSRGDAGDVKTAESGRPASPSRGADLPTYPVPCSLAVLSRSKRSRAIADRGALVTRQVTAPSSNRQPAISKPEALGGRRRNLGAYARILANSGVSVSTRRRCP